MIKIIILTTTISNTSHYNDHNNLYLYPQLLFEIRCSFRLDMLTVCHHWGAKEVEGGRVRGMEGGREGEREVEEGGRGGR